MGLQAKGRLLSFALLVIRAKVPPDESFFDTFANFSFRCHVSLISPIFPPQRKVLRGCLQFAVEQFARFPDI
jgi:hypothetical protein